MIAQQTFTFVDGRLMVDDNVTIMPCWMSTQTEINDFCPVVKDGEIGDVIIEKVNALSESLGASFDLQGHPTMSPAMDSERDVGDAVPYQQMPARVPSIIYTLLGQ